MTLKAKLTTLCEDLWMVLPPQKQNGSWDIALDAKLEVRFLEDKSRHVLSTLISPDIDSPNTDWTLIEGALRSSYAWPELSTHLATDESGGLFLQTLVAGDAPYDEFFAATNAHCRFCDSFMHHLQAPPAKPLDYRMFIAP